MQCYQTGCELDRCFSLFTKVWCFHTGTDSVLSCMMHWLFWVGWTRLAAYGTISVSSPLIKLSHLPKKHVSVSEHRLLASNCAGHLYQSHVKTQLQHSAVMRLAVWLAPVSHICCNTWSVSLLTEPEPFAMVCFCVWSASIQNSHQSCARALCYRIYRVGLLSGCVFVPVAECCTWHSIWHFAGCHRPCATRSVLLALMSMGVPLH